MKRAALVAGVSMAVLVCVGLLPLMAAPLGAEATAGPTAAAVSEPETAKPARKPRRHERTAERRSDDVNIAPVFARVDSTIERSLESKPEAAKPDAPVRRKVRKAKKSPEPASDKLPPVPQGPLHVIVSIDKQQVTLFADGAPVTTAKISSGTPDHPTPMGVFSVIQKNRHHVSNLYGAEMPFMQRITWSGSALHQGPLPGRPASHGCVRLPTDFAQMLWKTTKIGARVIITRDEAAPVPIEHARLFVPTPNVAVSQRQSEAVAPRLTVLKTADATNSVPIPVGNSSDKPLVSAAASRALAVEQPTKMSIDGTPVLQVAAERPTDTPASIIVDERPAPAAPAPRASRKPAPVSVFVSLKERRLYVRQGMEPLFDTPVAIEQPDQPIGTHVYTAMSAKPDGSGLRWTVVSIPSSTKRAPEQKTSDGGKKPRPDKTIKPAELKPEPLPSASAALDRIVMPQDAIDRIAALVIPGSSLIVSDNKLSGETGSTTDFIVLTR